MARKRGEEIAAGFQPVRNARRERRVLQFGAIHQIVYRHQAIQIHRSGYLVQILGGESELLQ